MVAFLCGLALAQQADAPSLAALDSIIQTAIQNHEIPGAVLLVGHDGHVIYRKAFGERSLNLHTISDDCGHNL